MTSPGERSTFVPCVVRPCEIQRPVRNNNSQRNRDTGQKNVHTLIPHDGIFTSNIRRVRLSEKSSRVGSSKRPVCLAELSHIFSLAPQASFPFREIFPFAYYRKYQGAVAFGKSYFRKCHNFIKREFYTVGEAGVSRCLRNKFSLPDTVEQVRYKNFGNARSSILNCRFFARNFPIHACVSLVFLLLFLPKEIKKRKKKKKERKTPWNLMSMEISETFLAIRSGRYSIRAYIHIYFS